MKFRHVFRQGIVLAWISSLLVAAAAFAQQVEITQSGDKTEVAEGGADDSYTVFFGGTEKPPTANVAVTLTVNTSQLTVTPTNLTFTPANWSNAQTVTVAAFDDTLDEDDQHTSSIAHAAASEDSNYNGVSNSLVVYINDNDEAKPGISITESGGKTEAAEGGADDSYTVVLNTLPTTNVTVTLAVDTNQLTLTPTNILTFTTSNWNNAQMVIVAAIADGIYEGYHSNAITHVATSDDSEYNEISTNIVVFIFDQKTLTVSSAWGGEYPGTVTTAYNTVLSQFITNSPVTVGGTQYVCIVGTVGGNDYQQVSPTNVTLTLTNDATLTWQWQTRYRGEWQTAGGLGQVDQTSGWYQLGSNVVITATPSNGYHFTNWTGDTNGCALAGNVITAAMTQARSITANFAIDTYTLIVTTAHGTATPAGATTNDWNTLVVASVQGSPFTVGTTQYVCTGWIGTGSAPGTGVDATNTSFNITNNSTLTWVWNTNYWLATAASGPGSVNVASAWYVAGSSVTITATPDEGAAFTGWTGDVPAGNTNDNPLTLTMDQARAVTANFAVNMYNLQVVSAHGTPSPAVGTHAWSHGSAITASLAGSPEVNGATQYVCTGWTGTGSAPGTGATTNTSFNITTNTTLTWNWKTRYWLDTTAGSNGSVDVADAWHDSGSNVTITATASNGYHFTNWTGDTNGCAIAGNVITAAMTQARSITANFAIDTYTLIVTTAHGTATPAGATTNDYNTLISASVAGSPQTVGTTQYVCTGWSGTGSAPGTGATTNTSFNITNNTTLTWNWKTQYWFDTTAGANGSVNVADAWYDSGSNVTITATPSNTYGFAGWTGDVPVGDSEDNPLALTMDQARSVRANFVDITGPTVAITAPTTNNSYTTTNSSLDIAGTASDNEGVTRVIIANNRAVSNNLAVGTTNWQFSAVPLYSGTNYVDVVAEDTTGHVVTNTLVVNYAGDNQYEDVLRSGVLVQEIVFPDNLTPGSNVIVQWKVLSYLPVMARLYAGIPGGWFFFRNGEYSGYQESEWNLIGRKAGIYSFECNWPVPQKSGDNKVWLNVAQMDGGQFMIPVIPDGVDTRPDPQYPKVIRRTILAGGNESSPQSDADVWDSVRTFETIDQHKKRSGATITWVNVPTNNLTVGSSVTCQWKLLSYLDVNSQLLLINLASSNPWLTTNATQVGSPANSTYNFYDRETAQQYFAKEYSFEVAFIVPTNVGTQQIFFRNQDASDTNSSWMAANLSAGIDARPAQYHGMYGRFIERTIVSP